MKSIFFLTLMAGGELRDSSCICDKFNVMGICINILINGSLVYIIINVYFLTALRWKLKLLTKVGVVFPYLRFVHLLVLHIPFEDFR
jgi:hypothetical protein